MIFHKKNRNYSFKYIIIPILFFLYFVPVSSQINEQALGGDTIYLKKGSTLIYENKRIKIKSDTVIYLPSYLEYEIIPSKNEQFYRNLENRANNNFWIRELHNIILAEPEKYTKKDSFVTKPSAQDFYAYNNRPVRHIIIRQLPVFGPTIIDTLRKPKTFIERTGNRLHFQTKVFLIQKNLLFKEKDAINPDVLADNERLLRGLPYVDDSKIEIFPLNNSGDSVDVVVIVKDNWSMAFDLRIDNITTGRFDLVNKNIFGFGQEIQNSALWDKRKRPGTGYEGSYTIHNIAGSFFTGNFFYNKSFGTQLLKLNVNRNFFTPNIKYAGGFLFKNVQSDIRYFSNKPPEFFRIEYNQYEIWTGRSFLLNDKNYSVTRQNLTLAGKFIFNKFYQRPIVTKNSYYTLWNKSLLLFSLIYTNQNFFKSNLIYNFGRTEDIPVGTIFSTTGGYEVNQFYKRLYFSGSVGIGKFLGAFGYIQSGATWGAFINKQKTEQGVLLSNINYFSNLFIVNRFKFRQFITLNLTKGINQFERDFITMNNRSGISGYSNDSVYGNQRVNMKWETDCFTPWEFYEFKFVLFIYADHTWLSKSNQNIFYGLPYTGFGFGMRLRNERLVFNTIQLRFTFYPNIPPDSRTNFVKLSAEPTFNPVNFSPKAPELIPFQ